MINYFLLLLFLAMTFRDLLPALQDAPIDLEAAPQDFILEVRKIEIEGYPDAFNPSITRFQGTNLLAFRFRDPATEITNQIGFVWLDDDFRLAGKPYILDPSFTSVAPLISRVQDPRLITIGNKLWMVFNNVQQIEGKEIRRMFVGELDFDGRQFFFKAPPVCIARFEGMRPMRHEKNWVPFDYRGQLLFSYSLFPHLILSPSPDSSAEIVASSQGAIHWNFGELRGGTPAILDGDNYLAFLHSVIPLATAQSNGKKIDHYFMGAYTFSPHPPFNITAISPEPIIGKNFYSGAAHKTWKPLRVVFPGGIISNEKHVWVVYGRQDFELWIAKFDKKRLLDSLVRVD